MRGFGGLVRDRVFVGTALTSGLASASMFAYIAGATFVLQRIYGLSAQGFSFAFGANSIGIMVMSQVGARLVHRHPPERILSIGLAGNLIGSIGVAVTVLGSLGLQNRSRRLGNGRTPAPGPGREPIAWGTELPERMDRGHRCPLSFLTTTRRSRASRTASQPASYLPL